MKTWSLELVAPRQLRVVLTVVPFAVIARIGGRGGLEGVGERGGSRDGGCDGAGGGLGRDCDGGGYAKDLEDTQGNSNQHFRLL